MSRALSYLGIARKAGALETGENGAGTVARAGKARLIILAADASDNARKRAESLAGNAGVQLCVSPFTKSELSAMTGKSGCSMAALTDLGLAASFAGALAQEYGENYLELTERLELKLRRAREREQEHSGKQGKRRNDA